MKRTLLAISLIVLPAVFSGCRLIARLPFYVEANEPLPKGAAPYEVRREQPYPPSLIDPALEERTGLDRSMRQVPGLGTVGSVTGLGKILRPKDVAAENREKIERALGRPIRKGKEKTNPLHADPFPDVDVVLALSGGGMRAANLSSAVMLELSKVKLPARNGRQVTLLDAVDTISSVSGGGFAAAFYLYHRPVFQGNTDPSRAELHADLLQVAMRENIQRRLLDAVLIPTKVSFYIRGTTRATRTNLYSNLIEYRLVRPQRIESLEATLYPRWWRKRTILSAVGSFLGDFFWIMAPMTPDDQYLFGAKARTFDDLYLRAPEDPSLLYPLRPEWIPNSTDYNAPVTENQFLFESDTFNQLGSDWLNFRVSDATAASAAFPVMFTPMTLRDWGAEKPSWQFLFDGGVSDNQGMNGIQWVLQRQPPGRKTVVIMVDASPKSGALPGRSTSRPGGMAITNRAMERYMNPVREDTIKELRQREKGGNLRFFHMSLRPDEFGSQLSGVDADAFDTANGAPTALSISRENQNSLFEVGRVLVARDREAMLEALLPKKAPAPVPPPSPETSAP
ncbi:MAG: patatin-like phospholipase family protein [Deltaproteobacteria bacterium]|nr:patatin-like phospholipase family protein [Deltaproteobacteria bacterium]